MEETLLVLAGARGEIMLSGSANTSPASPTEELAKLSQLELAKKDTDCALDFVSLRTCILSKQRAYWTASS